jgi:hypothetical protein
MVLAEPKGVEAQLFGPLGHDQHFFVVFLVGPAELRGIIAENENAEFHKAPLPSYSGQNCGLFLSQEEKNIQVGKLVVVVHFQSAVGSTSRKIPRSARNDN